MKASISARLASSNFLIIRTPQYSTVRCWRRTVQISQKPVLFGVETRQYDDALRREVHHQRRQRAVFPQNSNVPIWHGEDRGGIYRRDRQPLPAASISRV